MSDSDSRLTWTDLLEAAKTGGPLPAAEPVNPADLRCYWEFTQEIQAQHPPTAAGAVGIDIRLLEAEMPGANVVAVSYRANFLYVLRAYGALKEWERGTALDDVVLHVAATFPFGGNAINAELFREQLRAAGAAE